MEDEYDDILTCSECGSYTCERCSKCTGASGDNDPEFCSCPRDEDGELLPEAEEVSDDDFNRRWAEHKEEFAREEREQEEAAYRREWEQEELERKLATMPITSMEEFRRKE